MSLSQRPYITCRQLLDFIYDYLDGALPSDERREFERHLAVCPSCVHYLDTYRQTMRISKLALQDEPMNEEELAAALPESLVQSIAATLSQRA